MHARTYYKRMRKVGKKLNLVSGEKMTKLFFSKKIVLAPEEAIIFLVTANDAQRHVLQKYLSQNWNKSLWSTKKSSKLTFEGWIWFKKEKKIELSWLHRRELFFWLLPKDAPRKVNSEDKNPIWKTSHWKTKKSEKLTFEVSICTKKLKLKKIMLAP